MTLLTFGECRWCGADGQVCLPATRWRGRPLTLCRTCLAVRCLRRRWAVRVVLFAAVVGAIIEHLGRRAP